MGVRLDIGRCCGGAVGNLVDIVGALGRLVPSSLRSSSGKIQAPTVGRYLHIMLSIVFRSVLFICWCAVCIGIILRFLFPGRST